MKCLFLIIFLFSALYLYSDETLDLYIKYGSEQSIINYFSQSDFETRIQICLALAQRQNSDNNFFLEYLKSLFIPDDHESEYCIRILLEELNSLGVQQINREGFLVLTDPLPDFADASSLLPLIDWISASDDSGLNIILVDIGHVLYAHIPDDGRIAPELKKIIEKYIRAAFSINYKPMIRISSEMALKVRNYDFNKIYRELEK